MNESLLDIGEVCFQIEKGSEKRIFYIKDLNWKDTR